MELFLSEREQVSKGSKIVEYKTYGGGGSNNNANESFLSTGLNTSISWPGYREGVLCSWANAAEESFLLRIPASGVAVS